MRRPYWRSLTGRLALAFVFVSLVTLVLVGLSSYLYTRAEFGRLLTAQVQAGLTADLQAYYRTNGTLQGYTQAGAVDRDRLTPAGGRVDQLPPPRPAQVGPAPAQTPPQGVPRTAGGPFYLLDADFRTLDAVPGHPLGSAWPAALRVAAVPVTVTEQPSPIAYLLPTGNRPPEDARSRAYLSSTARASLLVTLVAALLAVGMGFLMARTLLQPLRGLLRGIHAMQRGEAVEPLPARPDELGELLAAFQTMSLEVASNQQARRQLTADIAHDLNTPLSVIGGTLEGMLDGTFQPTPERLGRLHRETLHVSRLVRDLRFLALADAGELTLDRTPVDLRALLSQTVAGFQEMAGRQGVTLRTDLPTLPPASLDPTRISQVLQNLLGNALAHTGAGDKIAVRAGVSQGGLWISVEDTGRGIPAGQLPQVFERLFRADTARSGSGSGLGLSISRSIVEAHGGEIGISSSEHLGTTVSFTLPLS